jgi:antitoxin MazE
MTASGVSEMTEIPIVKWGKSSTIRLPKAVLDQLNLKVGQSVKLTVENGKAVLEPMPPRKVTLEWITAETKRLGPENAPETVDWGPDRALSASTTRTDPPHRPAWPNGLSPMAARPLS